MQFKYLYILVAAIVSIYTSCNSVSNKSVVKDSSNYQLVSAETFERLLNSKEGILIDVRSVEEFQEGHITNAFNIDINSSSFDSEISKLDKTKTIYVYCLAGGRSGRASEILKGKNFKSIIDLEGGIQSWTAAGFKTSK